MKRGWIVIPAVFIANTVMQTILAWDGNNFPLIMLAVSTVILCLAFIIFAKGWREALDGWGRSTTGWGAAQQWGMRQDSILRDALQELEEYDEEAVRIHGGRSTASNIEYLSDTKEAVE